MTTRIKPSIDVTRRDFIKGTGALGFAIALNGTVAGSLLTTRGASAQAAGSPLSVWLTIHPDNTITILTPGAEMGQGSMTSVPLMLAEELDADWDKVRLEWAPSDVNIYGYGNGNRKSMAIVGSRAVRSYFDQMRIAGAQVRKVLLQAAAKHWNVPVTELTTEPGVVVHAAGNRRLTYGEIAQFADIPASMPEVSEAELKKPAQYRLIGTSQPRRDIPLKVNGTAQFAIDVTLPGMQYATTVHSPVQGAAPESWNDAEIKALKGITATVKLPTGVAIVGDSFAHVMAARKQLQVQWGETTSRGYDSESAIEQAYLKVHADPGAESKPVFTKGDADTAFASAARTYRADFRSDYGYHAQMEPLNAVARFNADNTVEVWDGSQSPDRCRQLLAEALDLDQQAVTVNQCYMGGGFGRRSEGDYAVEAALVAREVKTPVKLIWTREEDIAYGMFRPQNYQCLEAALDASGKVVGWKHCIVGDGGSLLTGGMEIDYYYKIPNQYIDLRGTSHGIRLKHWRAVAHPFNIFAIEEFIDRMAEAEKVDPVTFRLERMEITDRGRRLFEKVAQMSDWHTARPEGRALGLSITERSGSLGACVVEASLDRKVGKIKVHKVWMAVDGGLVVQPDAAKANIESGILYGISSVLHERVTVKDGVVQQTNFHDYNVMRMSDTPEEMHIEFVDPLQDRPQGLGEISNPAIPAAVAGAFYRLTGKRLSHMPFTRDRVLAALQA